MYRIISSDDLSSGFLPLAKFFHSNQPAKSFNPFNSSNYINKYIPNTSYNILIPGLLTKAIFPIELWSKYIIQRSSQQSKFSLYRWIFQHNKVVSQWKRFLWFFFYDLFSTFHGPAFMHTYIINRYSSYCTQLYHCSVRRIRIGKMPIMIYGAFHSFYILTWPQSYNTVQFNLR